jgi:glycosyltransferase involved in cell wall biosynthesis
MSPRAHAAAPLVSVVIPTYNRAAFLPATLDSVLAQTYPAVEIVVIDDGSSDGTPGVLGRYAGRVRWRRKPNGGVASARNAGLEVARGDFIAFMDSDDLCLPDRIAAEVECFRRFPEIVLCSSDFSAFDETGPLEASHIASYYHAVSAAPGGVAALYPERGTLRVPGSGTVIPVLRGAVYEQLAWGNFIHPPTVMVPRRVAESAGGFDERIRIATEYDWLIRVCRAGPAAFLDAPLLRYRYSGDQLSAPRHAAQIQLDAIATLAKLRRDDPPFWRRHRARLRRRIGRAWLHAADAAVERDKRAAARQLATSLAHGTLALRSLRVALKILLPRAAVQRLRGLRARVRRDWQAGLAP